jgi:hypothetical protein
VEKCVIRIKDLKTINVTTMTNTNRFEHLDKYRKKENKTKTAKVDIELQLQRLQSYELNLSASRRLTFDHLPSIFDLQDHLPFLTHQQNSTLSPLQIAFN